MSEPEKRFKFIRKVGRKVGRGFTKAADYTFLPLSELRSLKNTMSLSLSFFKDLMRFSWAVLRANGKEMVSSDFYRKIFQERDDKRYMDILSGEQKVELLSGLSAQFFLRRLIAISCVFVVFLLSALSFSIGLFSSEPSYFRLLVMVFMTISLAIYLWVSMLHYERLRGFYKDCGGKFYEPQKLLSKIKSLFKSRKKELPIKHQKVHSDE